jgi:putative hydrolase of the HAD superfamily
VPQVRQRRKVKRNPPISRKQKKAMKYKAVIFDLFGTLVKNFSVHQYEGSLGHMASMLSAPEGDFIRLWYDTFNQRCIGELKSTMDNIRYICRELGVTPTDDDIMEAASIRNALTRNTLEPSQETLDTLAGLKAKGLKIGLVTDCSSEAPATWPDTSFAPLFDETIFSCQVGLKKPDPRIFRLVCERLRVEPEDCLYVGDGSSNELTGAAAVGMHPVLIRDPEEDTSLTHRVDFEGESWKGQVITSLKEILDLVEQ